MTRLDPLAALAAEVGGPDAGPVVAVGGRTAYDVGGAVDPSAREVRPPAGIVEDTPSELTVRVRAGTTVDDLDAALAEHGACVALPGGEGRTVGGVLAVGRSGMRRLGYGPIRDTVLEIRYVSADGRVVRAGGPTVKNVSGYDLPRLLVGSLGTLGILAEVVLRTRPVPAVSTWLAGEADPFAVAARLYRPTAVLWDGTRTWVLLEGHAADVEAQAGLTGLGTADGPPALPPHRWSLPPGELPRLVGDGQGPFLAQVGVGVVWRDVPQPPRAMPSAVVDLHRRIKAAFDPGGRLAPGRDVLAGSAA